MTLDEAIEYEKESVNNSKRRLEDIYEDNLENKLLTFEVKQHEQLAEWLEDYKHIKQWKSDIMDSFCKYDVNSFEELVANTRNKAIDDFVNACNDNTVCQTFGLRQCDIEKIAEQLKGGE